MSSAIGVVVPGSAGDTDDKLLGVLQKHAGKLPWVAAVFQPKIEQAASLLPAMLEAHAQAGPAQADAGSSMGSTSMSKFYFTL